MIMRPLSCMCFSAACVAMKVRQIHRNRPSLQALQVVKSKSVRICPLVCGRGKRQLGDTGAVACDLGYKLGEQGSCEKQTPAAKRHDRAEHSGPGLGRNCIAFNGNEVCQ